MHYKLRCAGQILSAVFVGILIGGILMTLVLCEFAYAKVSGNCANCHTMHNSQNATSMVSDIIGSSANNPNCTTCHEEPRAVLLRMNCLGCHGQDPGGASNIIALNNIPQVAHNASTDLAAGNYRHVFQSYGESNYGHNVHGFSDISDDSYMMQPNYPPGFKSEYDPSADNYQTGNELRIMCAGRNGCHGNRDYAGQLQAIKGAHHADDKILKFGADFTETGQGETVGKSYRFLYKVHGAEDNDWEATVGATDHNEYKGSPYGSSHSDSPNWVSIDTISEFCAECHGYFHLGGSSGIGSASSWLRHPTDIVLPDSGEYSAYTAYSTETPVARQNINGTGGALGTVTPDTDIVMCLSCHRAHASQYPDILRWDYSQMLAGDPSKSGGCFTCHTQKNVSP